MHADELVRNFLEAQLHIRTITVATKDHPSHSPRSNMSAPTTPLPVNAVIDISPASSPSPPPILGPAPSWVGANPDTIRNPFLNTILCSSLPASDLGELSALVLAMHGYFTHHGVLPPSLEDGALFHHINGLNIYRFV